MDLLDFKAEKLYFDAPCSEEVDTLLQQAAESYGDEEAEESLLQAYSLSPRNLKVLVALYRFYYYQYRLQDALDVANRTLVVTAEMIDFPDDWKQVTLEHLGMGAIKSMATVRFWLYCLKAAGFLNVRIGACSVGMDMLRKIVSLDEQDRIGAAALLEVITEAVGDDKASMNRQAG